MDEVSKLELISLIIQHSIDGSNIMEMMFKIIPSYELLKKYLDLMQENDLITYHKFDKTFFATSKGLDFLYVYNDLNEMIENCNKLHYS